MSHDANSWAADEDRAAAARTIAASHREIEPKITTIYRNEALQGEEDPNEPIRLLEVNPNTTASGIVPLVLPPHPPSGILYPSIIVEIHPTELSRLEAG
jgi:hypothetical protein